MKRTDVADIWGNDSFLELGLEALAEKLFPSMTGIRFVFFYHRKLLQC